MSGVEVSLIEDMDFDESVVNEADQVLEPETTVSITKRLSILCFTFALSLLGLYLIPSFATDVQAASAEELQVEKLAVAQDEWKSGIRTAFETGSPAGSLSIPALGLSEVFGAGVSQTDLRSGVGWASTSALSGEGLNVALAGHRNGWGGPFRNLDALSEGDELVLSWATGSSATYSIISSEIVDPTAVEHMQSDPKGSQETLTLITCDPPGSLENRLIVTAQLTNFQQSIPHNELIVSGKEGRVDTSESNLVEIPQLNNGGEEPRGSSVPVLALIGLALAFAGALGIMFVPKRLIVPSVVIHLLGAGVGIVAWSLTF